MAMMEAELVGRRKWLQPEHFARAYALVKVLPGAAALQMSIYLGQVRRGRLGGLVAGLSFILPAFILVLGISIAYERFQSVPRAERLFSGMQVAALVVILDSVLRMARPYRSEKRSIVIAIISCIAIVFRPSIEPLVILGFGILGAFSFHRPSKTGTRVVSTLALFQAGGIFNWNALVQSPIFKLTFVCLKAGALVFGTGLAIIPMLENDVVGKYHWLTHGQFLDGLAIGQVTPGPVVITSTFIGYKVAGLLGAVLATVAIILPGFINILIIIPPFERRISNSPRLKDFTHWAIPAVIGGILGSTTRLGFLVVRSVPLGILFVVTSVIVLKWRPPVWIVIPLAGITYFLL